MPINNTYVAENHFVRTNLLTCVTFNVLQLGGIESPDDAVNEPKKRHHFSTKSKPSDLIASYSAPTDQSATPAYISTRNISDEPDSSDADSALLSHPRNNSSVARVHTSPKRRAPQISLVGRSPLRQGVTKGLRHQTSSTENLLSPSSPLDPPEEQGVHSSQDDEKGYAESANIGVAASGSRQERKEVYVQSANGTLSNGSKVSFGPHDSANGTSINGKAPLGTQGRADSANRASTNGKASLGPQGHADSAYRAVSLGSRLNSRAESATKGVDNRASMVSQESREMSVEDILERLLQEESDVPMNFPKDQVSEGS